MPKRRKPLAIDGKTAGEHERLLSLKRTSELTTLSRFTLWRRWSKDGTFPKPISLGSDGPGPGRKIAFLESEVMDWIKQRAEARA